MQVRLYPHAVWSSLARTDSHGFPGHLQIAMKKTLRSNREAWGNQIKQVRSSTFLQMVHTHTHTHGQENTTKDCPLLEKTWENQASIQLSVSQEHPESNSEFGVKGALHPLPVVQAARKHSWVVVANKGDWKRLEKHGKGYLLLFQWWFTYFVFVRGPLSLSLSFSLHRPLHYVNIIYTSTAATTYEHVYLCWVYLLPKK